MVDEKCLGCKEKSLIRNEINTYGTAYGERWIEAQVERMNNIECTCNTDVNIDFNKFSKNDLERTINRWGICPIDRNEFRIMNLPKLGNKGIVMDLFRRITSINLEFLIFADSSISKECKLLVYPINEIDYSNFLYEDLDKALIFEDYKKLLEYLKEKYDLYEYFETELKKITKYFDSRSRYSF